MNILSVSNNVGNLSYFATEFPIISLTNIADNSSAMIDMALLCEGVAIQLVKQRFLRRFLEISQAVRMVLPRVYLK